MMKLLTVHLWRRLCRFIRLTMVTFLFAWALGAAAGAGLYWRITETFPSTLTTWVAMGGFALAGATIADLLALLISAVVLVATLPRILFKLACDLPGEDAHLPDTREPGVRVPLGVAVTLLLALVSTMVSKRSFRGGAMDVSTGPDERGR